MLSFSKGRPIAKIVGGEFNNEILFLDSGDNKLCCDDCTEKCERRRKKCCGGCQRSRSKCCGGGPKYDEEDEIGQQIHLRQGKLIPLPNYETRIPFIAGPSGSGKSTYASLLAENYLRINPGNDFYLFSRKDTDPVLDKLNPIRIKLDESLIEDPIDMTTELTGGTLILFDDVNTLQNDKIKKAIDKLMNDIMEVGRSYDITIMITNHLVIPNEKKQARTIMNEMQSMTVFPKSGSAQQIKYALKTYFGLDKNQIENIINLPSRWVTIFKGFPQTVMYENGAFIL
jgi:hypothetical protein